MADCIAFKILGVGNLRARVGVGGLKLYHHVPSGALPIHLFRHFCCKMYHLVTMHSVTADRQMTVSGQ